MYRSGFFILLFAALTLPGFSKEGVVTNSVSNRDDWLAIAEGLVEENLDPEFLNAIRAVDHSQVIQVLSKLEKELGEDYVLDLAELKPGAEALLPLLERYEETAPYAGWLRARIAYLEAAEELRARTPGSRAPNPSQAIQREIWIRKNSRSESWPRAALPHVDGLKSVFATNGVPGQLVWIAEVESSWNPKARSPKGAAGLFQLMPATAQRFGLRTTAIDQRLQPGPSAAAAAAYLRVLHAQFKDWRLALAAYNAGEGTVSRLMERRGARAFDDIATRLPAETQMYVPRVESILLQREGLKLSQLKAAR